MPIRKYKNVEDVPAPAARPQLDPETIRAFVELLSIPRVEGWGRLHAPGVHRHRSVEDLDRAREAATVERMRRVQKARS